ncbi:Schizosaccharomyces pombe specific protein [Schizosaccharomyces pombe]|uniref:Uncharacterized protein C27E2.14 n=1 Tax=Schizosaccharomyces pombe (strain 972 / ATCC 24843) TaxID=284812 RepID=YEIN_SCHPO|nr:uncharacterized protein SPAC27E2.14 [Schizosaccharomyces pombe]C6Y4B0.1 RecName: Full=Uncharacterized protein C27E2.14 [Schizosaccharomyces pombe 972h-]CBA11504.1 sequence orphan [Schizosaccharomyces pombe]|eukprot:NP_001343079.1 uncharacterized protein SPAC27E2.14 [Schizosaccharomyces pombe]
MRLRRLFKQPSTRVLGVTNCPRQQGHQKRREQPD